MRRHSQLKPFVYALFTQTKKKALAISRKCLISNVDQPGLEPGISRKCLISNVDQPGLEPGTSRL